MAKAHAGTRDAKNASECIHQHAGTACGPRANLPAGRMCYACTVRPHRTAHLLLHGRIPATSVAVLVSPISDETTSIKSSSVSWSSVKNPFEILRTPL